MSIVPMFVFIVGPLGPNPCRHIRYGASPMTVFLPKSRRPARRNRTEIAAGPLHNVCFLYVWGFKHIFDELVMAEGHVLLSIAKQF